MRNLWKGAAVFAMVASLAVSGLAASKGGADYSTGDNTEQGYEKSSTSSSGGGSGTYTPSRAAATYDTVSGVWTLDDAGIWHLSVNGVFFAGQWVKAVNPYANNASQWFYFDANTNMLTGWQWIRGADGVARCYYLNPVSDGSKGKTQLSGTTPDGWQVNADGAWVVEGVVQTR